MCSCPRSWPLHFCSWLLVSPSTSVPYPLNHILTPPIKPWPQHLCPKRLVSMITSQQNLDLALQIFHYARNFHPGFSRQPKLLLKTFLCIEYFSVQRSVRSLNTFLNALVQNKRYVLVLLVFVNCKKRFSVVPNLFTCNILIKALCNSNNIGGALKLLDEMPAMGMVPNMVTYTIIMGGYVSRGDMVGAKRVFTEILDRGLLPDAFAYTILMVGYIKRGRLADAIKVMDEMDENGIDPNDVTYGVMIEAYCKENKSGKALNLLDDMLEKKYIPSSALCCKVIDVLCNQGKVEDACVLWKRLLKKNCTPDSAITSTIIHWLCKQGKIREARKLFDQFEKGPIPAGLTYNIPIQECVRKGSCVRWSDPVLVSQLVDIPATGLTSPTFLILSGYVVKWQSWDWKPELPDRFGAIAVLMKSIN
ncbi:hypothetical protein FEM48_Zijuj07G0014200 [Ziziphus jujuba var. spinosa]|uniref:Uncharacterized protein n=1 Tax=Ziziphus jujuba var. spinosa TaxID=714518 RepID=A0A978V1M7_ZIZJJ|nr:hypothetical protein FEM48_Zijuj07G0014200 [Ziziphus jujuba var. spinosa]